MQKKNELNVEKVAKLLEMIYSQQYGCEVKVTVKTIKEVDNKSKEESN